MADIRGRDDGNRTEFIIQVQRLIRGKIVFSGKAGDQDGIGSVHQKGSHQDRAQEGLPADQREDNVVQLGMAFEDISFPDGDCLLAGVYVGFFAGVRGRKMLLEETAELVRPSFRDKGFPMLIDDLYGQVDAGIKSFRHGLSMFPSFLSMTAIYTLFLIIGLVGKPISLVLIYAAGAIPYNTWLVKGYLDGIPRAIDEAAYIDGCGKLQSFFKIILPVSKPIITYCAVSQFMLPWMDYILPNILLSKDKNKTLAVGLFTMITGKENQNFTMFAAGAVFIAVPITIMFVIFQKYLVQGIAAGANKG